MKCRGTHRVLIDEAFRFPLFKQGARIGHLHVALLRLGAPSCDGLVHTETNVFLFQTVLKTDLLEHTPRCLTHACASEAV